MSKLTRILFLAIYLASYSDAAQFQELNALNLKISSKAKELDFATLNISYLMLMGDSPSLYYNGTLLDSAKFMTVDTT